MAKSRIKSAVDLEQRNEESAKAVKDQFDKVKNYKLYSNHEDDEVRKNDGLISYWDFPDTKGQEPEPVPMDELPIFIRNLSRRGSGIVTILGGNDIEISLDGLNWEPYLGPVELDSMSFVKVRGKCTSNVRFKFDGDGFEVFGNIMSLVDPENFKDLTSISTQGLFRGAFADNPNLTSVENLFLPATELSVSCYEEMFRNCTGLTSVRDMFLPSRYLKPMCYQRMFQNTGLKKTPYLSPFLTDSVSMAYMFQDCKDLTYADLVVKDSYLSNSSLMYMFKGCTSLSELNENILVSVRDAQQDSMLGMFEGCSSLSKSPKLDLSELKSRACSIMFKDCTRLDEIWCDFPADGETNFFENWCQNVAPSGTFHSAPGTDWAPGPSGDPWEPFPEEVHITWDEEKGDVQIEPKKVYVGDYLTLTVTPKDRYLFDKWSDGNTDNPRTIYVTGPINLEALFKREVEDFFWIQALDEEIVVACLMRSPHEYFKFSLKENVEWVEWNGSSLHVPAGQKIWFCRKLTDNCTFTAYDEFTVSGKFNVGGHLGYMVEGDTLEHNRNTFEFSCYNMFYGSKVVDCSELEFPLDSPAAYCYAGMFHVCRELISIPQTFNCYSLGRGACMSMYDSCYDLAQTMDILPLEELQPFVYKWMFRCTAITETPEMWFNEVSESSCEGMFELCHSLNKISVPYCTYDNPPENAFKDWAKEVAEEGTFIEPSGRTWPAGQSANPWRGEDKTIHIEYDEYRGTVDAPEFAEEGTDVTIQAIPYDGYDFVGWSDGITDNPRTIHIVDEVNLEAFFVKNTDLRLTSRENFFVELSNVGHNNVYRQYAVNDGDWQEWNGRRIELQANDEFYIRRRVNADGFDGLNGYDQFNTDAITLIGDLRAYYSGSTKSKDAVEYSYVFYKMFEGCKELYNIDPKILDGFEYLGEHMCERMFANCEFEIPFPLPEVDLKDYALKEMFSESDLSCILPLKFKKVGNNALEGMFRACEDVDLTATDEGEIISLVAEELGNEACKQMFFGCERLQHMLQIECENIGVSCFESMFEGDRYLNMEIDESEEPVKLRIPDLPEGAFKRMFHGCSSITETPEMDFRTTSQESCYEMFEDCVLLARYIVEGYTWTSADNEKRTFYHWAKNVAEEGKFDGSPTFPEKNVNGNPWSIMGTPNFYVTNPTSDFWIEVSSWDSDLTVYARYKVGDDEEGEWIDFGVNQRIQFRAGDQVYLKRKMEERDYYSSWTTIMGTYSVIGGDATYFTSGGERVDKDMSLDMHQLFSGVTTLVDASELILPAERFTKGSYAQMFENCTNLLYAPKELPAKTVRREAYQRMFANCTKLERSPKICAESVERYSTMGGMFNGCTSLNYIEIPNMKWTSDVADAFKSWAINVAKQGTFDCQYADSWPRGGSGNPWGPLSRNGDMYVTSSSPFYVTLLNTQALYNVSLKEDVKYRLSPDDEWKKWYQDAEWSVGGYETINFEAGDVVYLSRSIHFGGSSYSTQGDYMQIKGNYTECGGDTSSWITGDLDAPYVPYCSLSKTFEGVETLRSARNLKIHRIVKSAGCSEMFRDCTNLILAPTFEENQILSDEAYWSMFRNTGIRGILLGTIEKFEHDYYAGGGGRVFGFMFADCKSLGSEFRLTFPDVADFSGLCVSMFAKCEGIEHVEITAYNYGDHMFEEMFANCPTLKDCTLTVHYPQNFVPPYTFFAMFEGCTGLVKGPVIPLFNSNSMEKQDPQAYGMFDRMYYKCTSLREFYLAFDPDTSSGQHREPYQFLYNVVVDPTILNQYKWHTNEYTTQRMTYSAESDLKSWPKILDM